MWHCNYKFPFDYWVLRKSNGDIIDSVKDGEQHTLIINEESGEYIEKINYKGCPKFNVENNDIDL